ncbi:helix-turn-helix domain-containing protein [Hymenobacter jeollabukensis]|uniref:Helix-turn-helix domain-containing protein n=1 Tax=Hymenobacter jeollabukensis TaxID=2025313 RepID=A0A5R8WSL5_9BACT|nr:helix-turn-helix transcriptional regulator [Hymenobacter jeollabukensis]TLM94181.1 helix-turn-helix domain-containing protein [Hymenobacter jeollabukensis]
MSTDTLEALPAHLVPVSGALPLLGAPREAGQFNVFRVADLMAGYHDRPPMTFGRRPHYKISLIHGRSRIEYADQGFDIERRALFLATPRVPYRWLPHDLEQTGYFCIFTDEFLLPTRGEMVLEKLPMFQPGAYPVLEVSAADYVAIEAIFEKMAQEIGSGYAYKYHLLRAYLLELIHRAQKLLPAPTLGTAHTAAARLTAQFAELLERQFPLDSPQQPLRLRTARDYADALAVHVNHLNRVLKDATGHTTTALIGSRVTQEAKMLLRQTDWTISEIADCLGFTDVAHFCNFFKRQTGQAPGTFRE